MYQQCSLWHGFYFADGKCHRCHELSSYERDMAIKAQGFGATWDSDGTITCNPEILGKLLICMDVEFRLGSVRNRPALQEVWEA